MKKLQKGGDFMKRVILVCMCLLLFIPVVCLGQETKVIEFSWDKATIEDDLADFRIYMGTASMTQISDAIQTFDIPYVAGSTEPFIHEESISCPAGQSCTYYFRLDVGDTSGNRSTPWSTEEPVVTIEDITPPEGAINFKAIIKVQ
jgi:hypothetical protein